MRVARLLATAPNRANWRKGPGRMKILPRMVLVSVVLLGCAGTAQAQQGNAEEGENVFRRCRTCHDIGSGAKAASADGFAYSTDMKALGTKGFVWNEENLRRYLANVKDVVPSGKMVFPGLTDEQDREDLIAYLKKFSQ